MDVFKDQWEKQVRVLTEAVDDITSVDDFLSVSGTSIGKAFTETSGSVVLVGVQGDGSGRALLFALPCAMEPQGEKSGF